MALDVRALAAQGMTLAKSLVPDAFETVTVRLNPTFTTGISADTSSAVWGTEATGIKALRYDDETERKDAAPESILKSFLVDVQDLPDDLTSDLSQAGEIEDASEVIWEVYRSEWDPSKSVATFFTRRGKTAPSK